MSTDSDKPFAEHRRHLGLRNRRCNEVGIHLVEELDAESAQSTPSSSESTQLASEGMSEMFWDATFNQDTNSRIETITLQITGNPEEILRAIAGFSEVVVLHSKDERLERGRDEMNDQQRTIPDNKVPPVGDVHQTQRQTEEAGERTYFNTSLSELIWRRSSVLISLLILQSASSVVLSSYQQLIERNVFLALFLTMLTGTGGNAGNQSSALVIRGLSTGEITRANMLAVLTREVLASAAIGAVLATAAFARVIVTDGCDVMAAGIVSVSTMVTVVCAIAGGTVVPMALEQLGLDTCNLSAPILTTLTDVMGVLLLCLVTTALVGET